ncbi:hypothetical protein DCO58_01570 [Helicobacter saguini]|uniref:Uncharacterized protein n=1 Tax=Helicobacter saguini TaxID=1548018 RepID=A0A6B0HN05_9HELI|nr:hypothetical protein [Helicobacter saguini]MWV62929.1 hypothetical protein [Helicobacter saguini]MWV66401.1 hypothetical protein [Helicobacter saguini]MWV68753.1 hypothetical protein [Helicobacter saguini]MWV71694.1 hypothetical protein [Helicobacter saguini]
MNKNDLECLESCLCDIAFYNFQRMIKDCKGNDSKLEYLQIHHYILYLL